VCDPGRRLLPWQRRRRRSPAPGWLPGSMAFSAAGPPSIDSGSPPARRAIQALGKLADRRRRGSAAYSAEKPAATAAPLRHIVCSLSSAISTIPLARMVISLWGLSSVSTCRTLPHRRWWSPPRRPAGSASRR
jgi:hypothetical protein